MFVVEDVDSGRDKGRNSSKESVMSSRSSMFSTFGQGQNGPQVLRACLPNAAGSPEMEDDDDALGVVPNALGPAGAGRRKDRVQTVPDTRPRSTVAGPVSVREERRRSSESSVLGEKPRGRKTNIDGFAALSYGAHARAAQAGPAAQLRRGNQPTDDVAALLREMLEEQAKLGEKMDNVVQQLGAVAKDVKSSKSGVSTVSALSAVNAFKNAAQNNKIQRGLTGNVSSIVSSNRVQAGGDQNRKTSQHPIESGGPLAHGQPPPRTMAPPTPPSEGDERATPQPGTPQGGSLAGSQGGSRTALTLPAGQEEEETRPSVTSVNGALQALQHKPDSEASGSRNLTPQQNGDTPDEETRSVDEVQEIRALPDEAEQAESGSESSAESRDAAGMAQSAVGRKTQGLEEDPELAAKGCLLLPTSPPRLVIDLLTMAFVISDWILVPITVCFRGDDVDFLDSGGAVWLSTLWFTFEIIMNCCTVYYAGDRPVLQHGLILRNYVSSRAFLFDVVPTVPWDMIVLARETHDKLRYARAARLVRLVRVVKVPRILAKVSNLLEHFLPPSSVVVLNKIGRVCLFLPCYFHIIACFWGLLGDPDGWLGWDPPPGYPDILAERRGSFEYSASDSGEITWLTHCSQGGPCEPGIVGFGSPWLIRYGFYGQMEGLELYSYCLQWATAIFTTIGLDVVAGNMRERIFFYIANVGSFLAASVLIANVVSIIQRLNMEREEFDHRSRMVRMFLKKHKLSLQLQERIRRYLAISFDRAREVEAGECATTYLSEELQKDILLEVRIGFLLRHPFFKELQREAIRFICFRIRHVFKMSGDPIFVQGQMANSMIFLMSGTFTIVVRSDTGTIETPMPAPCWIGDFCLFTPNDGPCVRAATVKAQTDIEYLEVDRDILYEVVNDFPTVHDHFVNFVNQISQGNFVSTGIQCSICGGFGHSPVDCAGLKGRAADGTGKAGSAFRERVRRKLKLWAPCLARYLHGPSRETDSRRTLR